VDLIDDFLVEDKQGDLIDGLMCNHFVMQVVVFGT
jgi:hypothetical protein